MRYEIRFGREVVSELHSRGISELVAKAWLKYFQKKIEKFETVSGKQTKLSV